MNFDYPPGSTPIDPDEVEGLLLSHITNRAELDSWEQDNIKEAEEWAFRRKPRDLISTDFACRLMTLTGYMPFSDFYFKSMGYPMGT